MQVTWNLSNNRAPQTSNSADIAERPLYQGQCEDEQPHSGHTRRQRHIYEQFCCIIFSSSPPLSHSVSLPLPGCLVKETHPRCRSHHQRCSEKTSGPFPESRRRLSDVLFAESTEVGSRHVDTSFKMTPHRLALRNFMMKSCVTIHRHMCSSNI